MDKISFKLIFFLIVFLFGTLVSGGNWLTGFVCAALILTVLEIGLAYERGKKDGRHEYLKENEKFAEQVNYLNKTEKDRKKEEDENMYKLKSAKTGQPIIISKSYGVIGPNGEDDGKRFVRKEDAEKYLKAEEKKAESLVGWLRDAEQIPEEGESVDEFVKRTGWTLEKENYWRKIDGLPLLKNEEEYRKLFIEKN
jgi:hypothetical protein